MKPSTHQSTIFTLMLIFDAGMLSIAWILAYTIRFHTFLATPFGIPSPTLYFKMIPFILLIWLGLFAVTKHYKRSFGGRSPVREGIDIIQTSLLATVSFIAFTYFYEEYRYSRLTLIIFIVVQPLTVILGRTILRKIIRAYRRRAPERRLLLIGSGQILTESIELVATDALDNNKILGAILTTSTPEDLSICKKNRIPIIEFPENWNTFFSENVIHRVVFGLSYKHYWFLEDHLSDIANQVADITIIPDLMRYSKLAAGVSVEKGRPVINLQDSPLSGAGRIIKRAMDIAGAGIGLVLLAPIFATIMLLVRLTSKGPIYFRQERMGLDGRKFECLKFRTMPIDAEKSTGAVFARPNDNRATRIGRILRKTSLDELPQLFNVLQGDMSLVGPRPERPIFVNQFRQQVPGYMLRHKVKTGITGWAQVNGWRGDTSIEKRIECDLFYIQNWSAWLDIKILLLTIEEVLTGKNAY